MTVRSSRTDVAALNGFFFDSPVTIRYAMPKIFMAMAEIKAYRSAVTSAAAVKRDAR